MTSARSVEKFGPWSPAVYQIEVEGELPSSFPDYFGDLVISEWKSENQQVMTRLIGPVDDQSALMGLLQGLADHRLPILAVNCLTWKNSTATPPSGEVEGGRSTTA